MDRKTSSNESCKYKGKRTKKPAAVTLDGDAERLSKKSTGWMPWHWEPKKDVTSCEKLRGVAHKR